ncbi:MAG TPA: porphobilinogen synthase [Patescibacteria group bacterium]|nr:porphobilinogen synthase [Patescibacteria group bacterium]
MKNIRSFKKPSPRREPDSPPLHDPGRARPRRNRRHEWTRKLVAENTVTVSDLIWPVFVMEGQKVEDPIKSMPGVTRWSLDVLLREVEAAATMGIPAIALFPVVDASKKSPDGHEAWEPNNLICRTIRAIKSEIPDIGIICDVALDPYTSHGHDGLLDGDGYVANDETVEVLCRQALVQAEAGVDIVAPSDMMDGRVGAIRDVLDEHGFTNTSILSYAAKYASAFYGPFRDAVNSGGYLKGDKKTYQMDPANGEEAILETSLDIDEGADMVMVKPGLPYLDVIRRVKDQFRMPTFAYNVSGEYAMLKAAAQNGWLDYDKAVMEMMVCFKRAGADGVLTYAARDIARLLGR